MLRAVTIAFCVLLSAASAFGDDLAKSARAKADEVGSAVIKEDYAKLIELTYPEVVKLNGGSEKMIDTIKSGTKAMKEKGFSLESNKTLDPHEPVIEKGITYIVIPTQLEMKTPMGKLVARSYLLGISPDAGKTWTFIDGAGMRNPKAVKQVLPDLPDKVKLPERVQPMVVKE